MSRSRPRSLHLSVLAVAVAMGVPVVASASPTGAIETGVIGGLRLKSDNNELGNSSRDETSAKSGAVFGLRGGYAVTDRLGAELELTAQLSHIPAFQANPESSALVLGGRVWGAFTILPSGRVQPFVRIGASVEQIRTDSKALPASGNGDTDFGAMAGVGVRVPLLDRLIVRADVVTVLVPGRDNKTETELEGTVSIGWLLGGKPADSDNDGIADDSDRCPAKPEDVDGYEDADGCPDPDNDRDGVADAVDLCPREAETKNGFDDGDGCPDKVPEAKAPPAPVDSDGDGLLDPQDKCPAERETVNRFRDGDGCADTVPAALQAYVDVPLAVEFGGGNSKLGGKSGKALEALLKALQAHADVVVEIVGHTDESANADANRQLSQQRAEAVKAWLVGKGVTADRIRVTGKGAEQPRAGSVRGDAKNRRIEIVFP